MLIRLLEYVEPGIVEIVKRFTDAREVRPSPPPLVHNGVKESTLPIVRNGIG